MDRRTTAPLDSAAPVAAASAPRRRRWLRPVPLLAVAAAAALGWVVFAPRPLMVEVVPVRSGPLSVTVDNQGLVRAHDVYTVTAPVAGELERSTLHDGDPVRQGAPVAVLRPVPLDARQRQEAQARLDAARAQAQAAATQAGRAATDLALASSERTRQARLVADGFLSAQALERASAAEQVARAAQETARFAVQAAQADVRTAVAVLAAAEGGGPLTLRAPVAGQVLRVLERSRRTVAPGTALLTIGDPARFEYVIDVLSTDAVRIAPGAAVEIDGWGGAAPLAARVRRVEPVAFTKVSPLGVEEQRVNVIADPAGSIGPLGDGYRIEARILVWSTARTLKLPGSATFRAGDGWHVFALQDGRLRERPVRLGQRNQDEVQLLDGLPAGTLVVRFPTSQMRDGLRARAAAP